MIWLLFGLCFVLLAGCAARAPLPATTPTLEVPLQLHVQRRGSEPADWLLVIQHEEAALRWSLLDPLGIPLARQQLRDGNWHADGLLRPNPEARELFAALLFARPTATSWPRCMAPRPNSRGLTSAGCARATACAGRSAIVQR